MDRQQAVGQAIINLTPQQVLDAVDRVYNQAFTTKAWNGSDTRFVSMTRYIQEVRDIPRSSPRYTAWRHRYHPETGG